MRSRKKFLLAYIIIGHKSNREYDEETEEITDEYANLSGVIADLTKTATNPGGITLFTDDTRQTYRSTYEILKDISEIWDEISDKNQAQLLQKLFGKTRAQTGAAILQNFSTAESSLAEMESAAGAADKEMETIRNSAQYKINALQQTWTGTLQTLLERDDLKDVLDSLITTSEELGKTLQSLTPVIKTVCNLLELLSKLVGAVSSLGDIGPAIITSAAIWGVKKAKGQELWFPQKGEDALNKVISGFSTGRYKNNVVNLKGSISDKASSSRLGSMFGTKTWSYSDMDREELSILKEENYQIIDQIKYREKLASITAPDAEKREKMLAEQRKMFSERLDSRPRSQKRADARADRERYAILEEDARVNRPRIKFENEMNARQASPGSLAQFRAEAEESQRVIDNINNSEFSVDVDTRGVKTLNDDISESQRVIDNINNSELSVENIMATGDTNAETSSINSNTEAVRQNSAAKEALLEKERESATVLAQSLVARQSSVTTDQQEILADLNLLAGKEGLTKQRILEIAEMDIESISEDELTSARMAELFGIKEETIATEGLNKARVVEAQKLANNIRMEQMAAKSAKALAIAKSMAQMAAMALAMFLIQKGIEAFQKYKERIDNATASLSEFEDRVAEMEETFAEHKNLVKKAIESYDELAEGVNTLNNINISLSDEDYEKFISLNNELAEAFPELKIGIDDNGNAILSLGNNAHTAASQLSELIQEEERQNNMEIAEKLPDTVKDAKTKLVDKYGKEGLDDKIKNAEVAMDNLVAAKKIFDNYSNGIIMAYTSEEVSTNERAMEAYNKFVEIRSKMIDKFGREVSDAFVYNEDKLEWNIDWDSAKGLSSEDRADARQYWENELSKLELELDYDSKITLKEIEIEDYQGEIESTWEKVQTSFLAKMNTMSSYTRMDSFSKELAKAMVGNLSSDIAAELDDENPYAYIQENVLPIVKQIGDTSFDANGKELSFLDLFDPNIDATTLSILIKQIQKYCDDHGITIKWDMFDVDEDVTDVQSQIDALIDSNGNGDFDDFEISNKDALKEAGILDAGIETQKEFLKITSDVDTIEEKVEKWAEYQEEVCKQAKNTWKAYSKTQQIDKLVGLSSGFDSLDTLYADIIDGEKFDYSNLDSSKFKEEFGDLEEEYTALIESISESPGKMTEKTQEAFDNLITAYVKSNGILSGVSEETKQVTIDILKGYGVTEESATRAVEAAIEDGEKAHTMANELLADEKYNLANATDESIDSTMNSIEAYLNEANASDICRFSIYELVTAENVFGDNSVDTKDKIKTLENLTEAYLGTAAAAKVAGAMEGLQDRYDNNVGEFAQFSGRSDDSIYKTEKDSTGKVIKTITVKDAKNTLMDELVTSAYSSVSKDLKQSITVDYNLGYNGGDKTQSANNSQNKNNFDWIEVAIQRIEREISNLDKVVEATYKTWTDRTSALVGEMEKVTDEMALQNAAAQTYMAYADAVNLSEEYKAKVRSGDLSIETINDEDLEKAINEYKEFYEKALDAQDKFDDLYANYMELQQKRVDQVASQYDYQISQIEHVTNMLDKYSNMYQTLGYMSSEVVLQYNIDAAQQQKETLQNEKAALLEVMGAVEDSEMYQNYMQKIEDVDSAIADCDSTIAENTIAIRDLKQEIFDLKQELVDNLSSELEFIGGLLERRKDLYNDNGTFSEYGNALVETIAAQYNLSKQQAEEYGKQAAKYLEEYQADPGNKGLYDLYTQELKAQQDKINEMYGYQDKIIDQVSAAYNKMLEHLKEVIDDYSELLDDEKSLYDYQKNITDQTTNIASLEKRLAALSGDNSEETQNTIQQLQNDLTEAQKSLEETQYEQWLSDQKKMLNKLYDDTEEWVNNRLDDIETLIAEQITNVNANLGSNAEVISSTVSSVGYIMSEDMNALLTSQMDIDNATNSAVNQINERVDRMVSISNEIMNGQLNNIINGVNNISTNIINMGNSIKSAIESKQLNVTVNVDGQNASSSSSGGTTTAPVAPAGTTYTAYIDGNKIGTSDSEFGAKSLIYNKGGVYVSTSGTDVNGRSKKHGYRLADDNGNYVNSKIYSSYDDAMKDSHNKYHPVDYYYASGTDNAQAGTNLIGEAGTELYLDNHGNAMLADSPTLVKMEGGETVFNADDTEKILKGTFKPMSIPGNWKSFSAYASGTGYNSSTLHTMLAQGINTNGLDGSRGNIEVNGGINISLPNVTKKEEFVGWLKSDGQIENIIQTMTLGQAIGNGKLMKNRY